MSAISTCGCSASFGGEFTNCKVGTTIFCRERDERSVRRAGRAPDDSRGCARSRSGEIEDPRGVALGDVRSDGADSPPRFHPSKFRSSRHFSFSLGRREVAERKRTNLSPCARGTRGSSHKTKHKTERSYTDVLPRRLRKNAFFRPAGKETRAFSWDRRKKLRLARRVIPCLRALSTTPPAPELPSFLPSGTTGSARDSSSTSPPQALPDPLAPPSSPLARCFTKRCRSLPVMWEAAKACS